MINAVPEIFIIRSRSKLPCWRSIIKAVDNGITTKNMANTNHAGTLCCTDVGANSGSVPE